jgi:hypothetical protein
VCTTAVTAVMTDKVLMLTWQEILRAAGPAALLLDCKASAGASL